MIDTGCTTADYMLRQLKQTVEAYEESATAQGRRNMVSRAKELKEAIGAEWELAFMSKAMLGLPIPVFLFVPFVTAPAKMPYTLAFIAIIAYGSALAITATNGCSKYRRALALKLLFSYAAVACSGAVFAAPRIWTGALSSRWLWGALTVTALVAYNSSYDYAKSIEGDMSDAVDKADKVINEATAGV